MRNKLVGFALGAMLLALCVPVDAQQPERIPRIGVLAGPSASFFSARLESFRQGLRELGYVEGKNILFEDRYAEGKLDRLPDLAAELVRLKVDLIVTASDPAIWAAKKAGPTIPIVFAATSDPVRSGIVSSLARPGGNITGLTNMSPDLGGKRLELLKEAFPKVTGWPTSGCRVGRGQTCPSQRWRLPPGRWDSNCNRLRCGVLPILQAHSKQRKGKALRHSPRLHNHLSILSSYGCWTSRQRIGCRGCIRRVSLLRLAA